MKRFHRSAIAMAAAGVTWNILVVTLMYGDLVLVAGVERNLTDFLPLASVFSNFPLRQLNTLQQCGLTGVSVHFSLEDRNVFLADLELGSVAQRGHSPQCDSQPSEG